MQANKPWPTHLGAVVSRAHQQRPTLGGKSRVGFYPSPISVTGGGLPGQSETWATRLSAAEADPEGYDSYGLSADSTLPSKLFLKERSRQHTSMFTTPVLTG